MYKGERFNSISHLIGAVAAIAGFFILLYISVQQGDMWKIISFSVYGSTLIALYLFSTLYHSFTGRWKKIFQKFDHIAIYLLIAGTYTPFTMVTLPDHIGWTMFAVIWALAMIGIVIDLIPRKGHRILPLVIYLLMGWLVVLVIDPLMENLTVTAVDWLIAGGLFYTMGVLFYVLSSKHKLAHGIWHLFVLAGSISHFVTIAAFV